MATAPKVGILGQGRPGAGNPLVLYTVAAGRRAVLSTVAAAEVAGLEALLRIHATAGAVGPENAVAFDVYMPPNTHYGFTQGITLGPGEKLIGYSDTGNVTYTLFGEETDVPA